MQKPKIGLALGSGGAKGWCHLGVLSVLDDLGVRPDVIAGTSMGALVGAAEAGGGRAALEEWARTLTPARFLTHLDFRFDGGGLVAGRQMAQVLSTIGLETDIEDLDIPFTAVATNLETGREVWFQRGSVLDGVRASVSIPGLFAPYCVDGRWLLDGGLVNPVPISVARAMGADVVIAVDPLAKPSGRYWTPELLDSETAVRTNLIDVVTRPFRPQDADPAAANPPGPKSMEVVNAALDILTEYLARTRMAADPPDAMVDVDLTDLSVLAFYEADTAIEAGRRAAEAQADTIRAVCGL